MVIFNIICIIWNFSASTNKFYHTHWCNKLIILKDKWIVIKYNWDIHSNENSNIQLKNYYEKWWWLIRLWYEKVWNNTVLKAEEESKTAHGGMCSTVLELRVSTFCSMRLDGTVISSEMKSSYQNVQKWRIFSSLGCYILI